LHTSALSQQHFPKKLLIPRQHTNGKSRGRSCHPNIGETLGESSGLTGFVRSESNLNADEIIEFVAGA